MKRVLTMLSPLTLASNAVGGIVVDIVPDQAEPYSGGESVKLDFWLRSEQPGNLFLRGIRFDFHDTDQALITAEEFLFDYSAVLSPNAIQYWMNWTYPSLPVPSTWMALDCFCKSNWMLLTPDDPIHIGSLDVELPNQPAIYRLDVLNADEPDWSIGALIYVAAGAPSPYWRAYTGEITGGTYDFAVIPEPSVVILISVGGAVVIVSRRLVPCRGTKMAFPIPTPCNVREKTGRWRSRL
jgi:hypothetical protein